MPMAVKEPPPVRAQRSTAVILLAAILVGVLCAGLLAVSFLLPFSSVEHQLVHLYGAQRTAKHFSPAVWNAAQFRLRLVCGLLLLLAASMVVWRRDLNRSIGFGWTGLMYSARHELRTKRNWKRLDAIALAAIVFVGVGLRLAYIQQTMRYDESATVLGYASKPLYIALTVYNEPNNHLFHTLLVHIAMKLAGNAEWSVRLPAFLAGSMLIVLAYGVARRLGGSVAGLIAAALVSASSILIEYSTNARGYTIICAATLAVIITGIETLRRASPAWFFLFGLTAVIGFWTIPAFLMSFGGVMIWLLWEMTLHRRRFRQIYLARLFITSIGIAIITTLLYLPPMAVSGPRALVSNHWVAPRAVQSFLSRNVDQFRLTWELWNRDMPVWVGWTLGVAFICSLVISVRSRRLVVCSAGFVVLLLSARHMVPFARNWLVFLPLFSAGAAISMAWLLQRLSPVYTQRLAPIAALAVSALLGVLVLDRGSILTSTETGILLSAPQIANFMASKGIAPDHLFRGETSDLPLQYYWWRRTGARAAAPTLSSVSKPGLQDEWFLLNAAYGDNLDDVLKQYRIRDVTVLGKYSFKDANLYHISCRFDLRPTA